ncbi:MAG: hypothetical protein Q7T57_07050 [Dehalococcoidales bacterium]|nr:hypothetical protein [Dehalococcoidales bacterium]
MNNKGLRNIGTFLTADSLLMAVLLVWAQLWVQPALDLWIVYYQVETQQVSEWFWEFNNSVSFGLILTFTSVLLAMIALAITGLEGLKTAGNAKTTPPLSLGLFASSLVLALINVSQSLVSVSLKFLNFNLSKHEGNSVFNVYAPSELPFRFIVISAFLFIIIVLSVTCAVWSHEKKPNNACWRWLVSAAFVSIVLELVSWFIFFGHELVSKMSCISILLVCASVLIVVAAFSALYISAKKHG